MSNPCNPYIYRGLIFCFVVSLGFEPRLKEPKSSVLPLHNETISLFQKRRKDKMFFIFTQKNIEKKIFFLNFIFLDFLIYCLIRYYTSIKLLNFNTDYTIEKFLMLVFEFKQLFLK